MYLVATSRIEPYGTQIFSTGCTLKRKGLCWWELTVQDISSRLLVLAEWTTGESVVEEISPGVFNVMAHANDRATPEGHVRIRVWAK